MDIPARLEARLKNRLTKVQKRLGLGPFHRDPTPKKNTEKGVSPSTAPHLKLRLPKNKGGKRFTIKVEELAYTIFHWAWCLAGA